MSFIWAGILTLFAIHWAHKVFNPLAAFIFSLAAAAAIFAAAASTFGNAQSYWMHRSTKGVPHGH